VSIAALTVVSIAGATTAAVSILAAAVSTSVFLSPEPPQATKEAATIAIAINFFIFDFFVCYEIFQGLIPEGKKGNPFFNFFLGKQARHLFINIFFVVGQARHIFINIFFVVGQARHIFINIFFVVGQGYYF
jgi:hypothetical protein